MKLRAIGDWLLEKDAQAQNALRYYLGPAYEPINALAQFGALMSPGADMMDMAQSSDALMHSPTWKDAGINALGLGAATLGAFIPGTARGIEEAVDTAADATRKGIRAYHGSPHDFDKFDSSRIGTGEGAQAYGHGLYFADNEAVARSYREGLTNKAMPFADAGPSPRKTAWSVVRNSPDQPDAELVPFVRNAWPNASDDELSAAVRDARAQLQPGRMYEVNINADPADFLDWDKPLSEQAGVTAKLEASGFTKAPWPYSGWKSPSGALVTTQDAESMYRAAGDTKEGAATALREAGIPGIKYLDQGSRAAGEGSRNYVVFDDNLISILRKYGLLGMIGGGAAATAASQNYGDGA